MLKLERILWADDGSKASENALNISECIARLYDSEIIGLYVNYVFYPITPNYAYYKEYIDKAADRNKREFLKRFREIDNKLSKKNIKFTDNIIRGDVPDTVRSVARDKKVNLIAIGNTGHGFISRMLVGSNALKILKASDAPVLAVPESVDTKNYQFKKILVPIDISDQNLNSLNFAIELALQTKSSITVLYVFSIATGFMEYPPKLKDQIITGIETSLNDLIQKAREIVDKHQSGVKHRTGKNGNLGISIRKKYLAGMKPSANITDYAHRNDFDLIVMNTHNKGKIEEFILGSVTEDVLRNSKTPVISIKS